MKEVSVIPCIPLTETLKRETPKYNNFNLNN